jgi:hypothetical protein
MTRDTVLLSEKEYMQIEQIVRSQIKDKKLFAELYDHLCCFVEDEIQSGAHFETALENALRNLSPSGLGEIEKEIFDLLHSEKITAMKKSLVIFGFLATFTFFLAFLFRFLKWEGKEVISFTSLALIAFFVIPLVIGMMRRSFQTLTSSDKFRILSGCAGGFVACVGQMFKILAYPGANLLFLVGMLILTFAFLPVFFWQLYNRTT